MSVTSVTPATSTASRFPFSPFPSGWYAVCFSSALPRKGVMSRVFAGRQVVVFRSESGRAAMLDAHCPHLGAHLGVGGRVSGEALRCPMHGFEFDRAGNCVATGYGTKVPPTCAARAWSVIEQNGIVLAYFDAAGGEPSWQPPVEDMHGFGRLRTQVIERLASHPQETTENSVDLGHLGVVHGYRDLDVLTPLATDGAHLTTAYRMRRRALVPGTPAVVTEFTVHVYGLGYSFVDARVVSHGLRTRHFVLSTPTDGEHVDLHLGSCVGGDGGLLGRVPALLLDRVLGRLTVANFLADVQQDLAIWSNKIYVSPPALAQGDGPIGKYRSWARQFYARDHAHDESRGVVTLRSV